MESSPLLIIANGSSVLDLPLGVFIDTFPVIGRINNFSVTGFEKFIGSHTHIWFNGANQGLKIRSDLDRKRVIVLVPAEILARKGEAIHDRIQKRLGLPRERYELIAESDIRRYETLSGIMRPTTGLNAILWGLEHFEQVVIHGYDFFIDSQTHYNETPLMRWLIDKGIVKKGAKHDLSNEKAFVEYMMVQGRIIKLTDIKQ